MKEPGDPRHVGDGSKVDVDLDAREAHCPSRVPHDGCGLPGAFPGPRPRPRAVGSGIDARRRPPGRPSRAATVLPPRRPRAVCRSAGLIWARLWTFAPKMITPPTSPRRIRPSRAGRRARSLERDDEAPTDELAQGRRRGRGGRGGCRNADDDGERRDDQRGNHAPHRAATAARAVRSRASAGARCRRRRSAP